MHLLFEPLGDETREETLRGLCENFAKDEPMSKCTGVVPDMLIPVFKPLVYDPGGYSHVVRDLDAHGAVVAACIANSLAYMQRCPTPKDLDWRVLPQESLVHALEARSLQALPRIRKEDWIELSLIYTARTHRGRGILRPLVDKTLRAALEGGVEGMLIVTTAEATQNMARKYGMREIARTSYADFTFEGKHVFSNISNPTHCMTWAHDNLRACVEHLPSTKT